MTDDKRAPMRRKVDEACADLQELPRDGRVRPCTDDNGRAVAQRVLTLAQDVLGDEVDADPVGILDGGVSREFVGPRGAEVFFFVTEDGLCVWTYADMNGGTELHVEPSEGEAGWVRALMWLAGLRALQG